MNEKRIPVIIDCDPGIDDTLALVVAFAQPSLNVLAVCTVAGNVSVEKTTANARAVLATLNVDCPIYRGAEGPLMPGRVIEAPEAHGVSGLGNYTLSPELMRPLEKEHAVVAMERILRESSEKVTLIAVGPLTNLALLFSTYPQIKEKIERISIMGGGLYTGNHTAAAEFNILADPEAAQIVYQSGIPIVMAGLDVTHKANLGWNEYEKMRSINNPVAQMACDALAFHFENIPVDQRDVIHMSMHDVVSVLALTHPEMLKGEDFYVVVETAGIYTRGYTLADVRELNPLFPELTKPNPNCHVLLDIDGDQFFAELYRSIQSYSAV